MDDNPYLPPTSTEDVDPGTTTIRYRTFGGQTFLFKLTYESYRDQIRRDVQQAINNEIGADHVVSISEHTGSFGHFSVVVWYRRGPGELWAEDQRQAVTERNQNVFGGGGNNAATRPFSAGRHRDIRQCGQ